MPALSSKRKVKNSDVADIPADNPDVGGRPTKLTEELMRRILDDIAEGVPKTKAFSTNGICIQTGYNWAANDAVFSRLMDQAEDAFEANTLKKIGRGLNSMGDPDWKASAMLLKMRRPEYRDKGVEVNVKAEASASNVALSQEDLEDIRRLNREAITGGPN